MAVLSDQSAYSVEVGGPYSDRVFYSWVNMVDTITTNPYYGTPPFYEVNAVTDPLNPYLTKVFPDSVVKYSYISYQNRTFAAIPLTVMTPITIGQFWPRGN